MKKNILVAIATVCLTSLSSFAQVCEKPMSAIDGKVFSTAKAIVNGEIMGCYIQAHISHLRMVDSNCGLTKEEIDSELIIDSTCSLKNEDSLTGYVERNENDQLVFTDLE